MTRSVLLSTLLLSSAALAQNDSNAGNDISDKIVARPVMQWRFDDGQRARPTLRRPIPGFAKTNTAMPHLAMAKSR
jgi:hypothetical protein